MKRYQKIELLNLNVWAWITSSKMIMFIKSVVPSTVSLACKARRPFTRLARLKQKYSGHKHALRRVTTLPPVCHLMIYVNPPEEGRGALKGLIPVM